MSVKVFFVDARFFDLVKQLQEMMQQYQENKEFEFLPLEPIKNQDRIMNIINTKQPDVVVIGLKCEIALCLVEKIQQSGFKGVIILNDPDNQGPFPNAKKRPDLLFKILSDLLI